MARTRLRGLSIGGIQLGIEVPEICEWEWPETPVAEFQCLPRDPEVHVGLRVGALSNEDLGGERYPVGRFTFEVARRRTDWQLGLSRAGRREQLALFDAEFRTGEITIHPDLARTRTYPLRGPLDEWIVLHRTVARGGLCLSATAHAVEGEAVLRLGDMQTKATRTWRRASSSLLGGRALIVREERDRLRLFRTPWSESIDPRLSFETPVGEIERAEAAELAYKTLLDPTDAADMLLRHSIVPLCDHSLLDRVLRNAQRIAAATRTTELGVESAEVSTAPAGWRSTQLQGAFVPPQGRF